MRDKQIDPTKIKPTADQCSQSATIYEDDLVKIIATWYPQMGGYVGRSALVKYKNDDHGFDAYVWHDGNFPFHGDDDYPAYLHHCSAQQFVEFGEVAKGLTGEEED